MRRRLGLLALVAAVAAGCGDSSAPPQAAPKPTPPAASTDLAPTIVRPEYQSRATVVQKPSTS